MAIIFRRYLTVLVITSFISPCFGQLSASYFAKADSFYFTKDYKNAKLAYELLITDTTRDPMHLNRLAFSLYSTGNYKEAERDYKRALSCNPNLPLKASVLSRLARISAIKNNKEEALDYIDSAISAGYYGLNELDTAKDFKDIRNVQRFKKIREQLFNSLYPCVNNVKAKEFDFWIGEWDVYQTGTINLVGNSVIQKISGGCAILENWSSPISEGKSINYIDDSTGKWKQVWVGSYADGKQDFTNGEYKEGAMRFSYVSKDAKNHKMVGRLIFYNQGTNQVRQYNEYSVDEGENWITSYDFTYIRKK